MSEQVNHPNHYQSKNGKETIEEMVDIFGIKWTCVWSIITAFKYISRAGKKQDNPYEQDISKAKWYLEWVKKNVLRNTNKNSIIVIKNYHKKVTGMLNEKESLHDSNE